MREKYVWASSALAFLEGYARGHKGLFLAEEVRRVAEPLIGMPHDARAWGTVFSKAARLGLICKNGYAPAKTSHYSVKPMWSRANSQIDELDQKHSGVNGPG